MKLLTYNFLTSASIKAVKVGYPLKLEVSRNSMSVNVWSISCRSYENLSISVINQTMLMSNNFTVHFL